MQASRLAGRRVLVLGASGFLGRWVSRELLERGAELHLALREPARLLPDLAARLAPGRLRRADLGVAGATGALVRALQPALVLNLAGYGVAKEERDPAGYERLNLRPVEELIEALGEHPAPGVRLIQVGSALEAGPAPRSLDELEPARPGEPYGRSKQAATERVARARAGGLAALTARPFTVFGPGERPGRLVPTLVAAARSQDPVPLSEGRQRRDWIYVEDVATALCDLAELEGAAVSGGRYPFDAPCLNLASGALTPVREFVLALADALGIARARLGFGDHPPLPEEMHHPPVPVDRLQSALGWTPPPGPGPGIARLCARLAEAEGPA